MYIHRCTQNVVVKVHLCKDCRLLKYCQNVKIAIFIRIVNCEKIATYLKIDGCTYDNIDIELLAFSFCLYPNIVFESNFNMA